MHMVAIHENQNVSLVAAFASHEETLLSWRAWGFQRQQLFEEEAADTFPTRASRRIGWCRNPLRGLAWNPFCFMGYMTLRGELPAAPSKGGPSKKPNLFRRECEEGVRQPPPQRRVAHSSTGVFRAELDEPDSNSSFSESPQDHQQLSTRTLNFGWEKLQSAAKARFAKEIQSVGKPTKKKGHTITPRGLRGRHTNESSNLESSRIMVRQLGELLECSTLIHATVPVINLNKMFFCNKLFLEYDIVVS